MGRRSYAGGAIPTSLAQPFSAADTSMAVSSLSGWPDGAVGPFAVVIGRETPDEEKVLCSSVNGNDITVVQRGYDGTVARDHSAGTPVEHCYTAIDADEANDHVNKSTGVHGIPAQAGLVGTTGAQTLVGKTMDFSAAAPQGNTATNIPLSASPQAQAALGLLDAGKVNKASQVGQIIMFAGANPAAGWLPCDGRSLARVTYTVLANTLGVPPGDATFTLPDLRDRFPVGAGSAYGLKASGGGTAVLAPANLPKHTHAIDHDHDNVAASVDPQGAHNHTVNVTPVGDHSHTATYLANGSQGGGNSFVRTHGSSGTVGGTSGAPAGNHTHAASTSDGAGGHAHNVSVNLPAFAGTSGDGGAALTAAPVDVVPKYVGLTFLIYTGVE